MPQTLFVKLLLTFGRFVLLSWFLLEAVELFMVLREFL